MKRQNHTQSAMALAANGELVNLSKEREHSIRGAPNRALPHVTNSPSWSEWCSGMDEFGGLVMLAATLVA